MPNKECMECHEAELKPRTAAEATFIPLAEVVPTVQRLLAELAAPLSGDPPSA